MGRTLEARLARLEAQVLPAPVVPWTPPEFSDEWLADVTRILQDIGCWESVLRSLPCTAEEETVIC
jgi:hypothetical protein